MDSFCCWELLGVYVYIMLLYILGLLAIFNRSIMFAAYVHLYQSITIFGLPHEVIWVESLHHLMYIHYRYVARNLAIK